jgi:4-diphosphocytidyl-2-C-methyl-D-erythritol kinase
MRLRALAKINLGLDVVCKRPDGYHEVRMIMQTINMYDQLDMEKAAEPGIRMKTNLAYIPVNENNLVYRAADLLMKEFQISDGLEINLKKVIPVAAGMAGGSSDAAAALIGVNRMFRLGLSQKDLMERGVTIGADVPYCIMRGTALAEGIGEKLTALNPMPKCYILIAKPGISVSTKFVYGALDANHLTHHPDIDGMIKAIDEQNLEGIAGCMENVLETVTVEKYPVIQTIKDMMMADGAMNAMMSGSGPTVFGIFDDKETAEKAADHLRKDSHAKQVFLTTPFNKKTGGRTNDK